MAVSGLGILAALIVFVVDAFRPGRTNRTGPVIRDVVVAPFIVMGFAVLTGWVSYAAAGVFALVVVGVFVRIVSGMTPVPMVNWLAQSGTRGTMSAFLVGLASEIVLAWVALRWFGWDSPLAALLSFPLVWVLSFGPATLASNLGTVVVGTYSGFRVWTGALGPIALIRDGSRTRLKANRDPSGFFGSFLLTPASGDVVVPGMIRVVWLEFAVSVLFSVIGIAALGIGLLSANAPLVLAGVAIGGVSIVSANQQFSITRRIPAALAMDVETDRLIAGNLLLASARAGERPRDWDPELVAKNSIESGGRLDEGLGQFSAFLVALDRRDISQAASHVDRAIGILATWTKSSIPPTPAQIGLIYSHAAYFAAWHRNNLELAVELLAESGRAPIDPDTRLLAEAAIAFREGDVVKARHSAERGLRSVAWWGSTGLAIAQADWLREIIDACDQTPGAG